MGYLREHLWPAILLPVSGLWTIYGFFSQAYELWTAGMPPVVWISIGAIAFMATVIILLARFQKNLSTIGGSVRVPETVPQSGQMSAGAASTRDVFKNEHLRFWDLIGRVGGPITGKTFVDCELDGPAVLAILNSVHLESSSLATDDLEKCLIEVPEGKVLMGIFGLEDCKFLRCKFSSVAFIGTAANMNLIRKGFSQRA